MKELHCLVTLIRDRRTGKWEMDNDRSSGESSCHQLQTHQWEPLTVRDKIPAWNTARGGTAGSSHVVAVCGHLPCTRFFSQGEASARGGQVGLTFYVPHFPTREQSLRGLQMQSVPGPPLVESRRVTLLAWTCDSRRECCQPGRLPEPHCSQLLLERRA